MVSPMSAGVRFLTTMTSARPPARSKARAVSYSQLVPGKTGINTLGRAAYTAPVRPARAVVKGTSQGMEASTPGSCAKTFSSLPE